MKIPSSFFSDYQNKQQVLFYLLSWASFLMWYLAKDNLFKTVKDQFKKMLGIPENVLFLFRRNLKKKKPMNLSFLWWTIDRQRLCG